MKNKIESILYVEDEKNIQTELADILKYYCHNLYLASDGSEGLELFKKHKTKIIISDIKMPKMDGIEMIKKIKELETDSYVIFTTAFSDTSFFQEAIDLQVDGYILKPIDLELLEKKINSIAKQIELKENLANKEQLLIKQAKIASLTDMLSNIAHQWRQPLNIISLSLSNIEFGIKSGNTDKKFLNNTFNTIHEQIQHLSTTIDDFRGFVTPAEKDLTETFNLNSFLDKSLNLLEATFKDNNIQVIKTISEKIEIYTYRNNLFQILVTLIENSKEALSKIENNRFIFINAKQEASEIYLTIKDSAGGVEEEVLDKIFEPYFTTKHQDQGIGLSLYTVYTLITEKLNGTISVENETFKYEDKEFCGVSFCMRLPVK